MKSEEIDKIVKRYAEERQHEPRRVAQEHFLAYAYLVATAGDVEQFLAHTRRVLTYYIDSLSLFENPFRNTQACWLLLMFLLFCFGLYMMTDDDLCIGGIIICTGTTVFGTSLWKMVWSNWLSTNLLIAYYWEIIDFIDRRQTPLKTEATA